MTQLKKWFPFKFHRKDRAQTGEPSPTAGGFWPPSLAPADLGRWMQGFWNDARWREPFSLNGDMERFFGDFAPARFQPSIDVVDEGSHVAVSAEMPGLDRQDIQLHVEQGMLTIQGQKKHEQSRDEEGCYRTERFFGSFRRVVPLPQDVDAEKAEAAFDKGVLTVRFPKTEASSAARKIEIR